MTRIAAAHSSRAPTPRPVLQRKCTCGNHSPGGGECEECRKEHQTLQRKPKAENPPASVPAIVHQVLRSPGQPLDPTTRAFMEPRFGHDFSAVRVHTDTLAAASARSVAAEAYAVGQNLVFDSARYRPADREGRRLLAHELAHVVQQGPVAPGGNLDLGPIGSPAEVEAGEAADRVIRGETPRLRPVAKPEARRAPAKTNVSAVATGECSVEQGSKLTRAIGLALSWLDTAATQLRNFIAIPSGKVTALAQQALATHFHTSNPVHAQLILDRVVKIRSNAENSDALTSRCAPPGDKDCKDRSTAAYTAEPIPADPNLPDWIAPDGTPIGRARGTPARITWCPQALEDSLPDQANTVVHEMAHALTPRVETARFTGTVIDRAYSHERFYAELTTAEAMDNAESYGNLVQDLATGRTKTAAQLGQPQDQFADCKAGQQGMVRHALALSQRWNTIARETIAEKSPSQGIFKKAEAKLASDLPIECENSCDSNVFGYYRYFLFIKADSLHLCPRWFSTGDPALRAEAIFALILMRHAGVSSDEGFRWARHAHSIADRSHERGEPPPPLPDQPFPQSTVPGDAVA